MTYRTQYLWEHKRKIWCYKKKWRGEYLIKKWDIFEAINTFWVDKYPYEFKPAHEPIDWYHRPWAHIIGGAIIGCIFTLLSQLFLSFIK